ncbi:hypothetical protein [Xanthomonas oryzae]|nr:hypothetical protein [Xanthomonas oryzae]
MGHTCGRPARKARQHFSNDFFGPEAWLRYECRNRYICKFIYAEDAKVKVRVDFSLQTSDGISIGHVEGTLEFPFAPEVGDTINLMFSGEGINIPRGHENGGILKVIERVITPNKNEDYLSIMLDDMIITNDIQANLIINYLSTSFKLNTNLYRGI